MVGRQCELCHTARPQLVRPKTGQRVCKTCFFTAFESEVHLTITRHALFRRGNRVGIGASGGKDSTVLAHLMKLLNDRHDYGLDLVLISVDEGIRGYRDDSLETVKRNELQYGIPLTIVSYEELYGGWSMDRIVQEVGTKQNCTFCGVLRRQALDRAAAALGCTHIVTGHNADDIAETVLMNLLRGDVARLGRCTSIVTKDASQSHTPSCGNVGDDNDDDLPPTTISRSKPFKYAYEKEIVLYAHYKDLDYFSTECTYSPEAFRGTARTLVKDLERLRPRSVLDVIRSGERMEVRPDVRSTLPTMTRCTRCGYLSSNDVCKACLLLQSLEDGTAGMRLGDSVRLRRNKVKTTTTTAASTAATNHTPVAV